MTKKDRADIQVYHRNEICVHGKEFRLRRYQSKLSLAAICERMNKRGWVYYPSKLHRLEHAQRFCLDPAEFMDLMDAMGLSITK